MDLGWKQIPDYPNHEINCVGQIRLKENTLTGGWKRHRLLRQASGSSPYLTVKLSHKGVCKTHLVHRLVYETFVGQIRKGCEINHKDGNKLNNSLANLEVVTHKENIKHAKDTGLLNPPREFRNHRCKLSDADVIKIKAMLGSGGNLQREIACLFGVLPNQISRINTGARRTHASAE